MLGGEPAEFQLPCSLRIPWPDKFAGARWSNGWSAQHATICVCSKYPPPARRWGGKSGARVAPKPATEKQHFRSCTSASPPTYYRYLSSSRFRH